MWLTTYWRYFSLWAIWNTSDFLWRQPPVIERIFIFSSKLCFSICYIHLLISEVHDRLGMNDGAWPAEDEIDEVILLYKTSGSNMVRDFYVLPKTRLIFIPVGGSFLAKHIIFERFLGISNLFLAIYLYYQNKPFRQCHAGSKANKKHRFHLYYSKPLLRSKMILTTKLFNQGP